MKTTETTVLVSILMVTPNPYQPESRLVFSPEVVKKMADSIEQHGLILPPVVREKPESPDYYEMGDGWLRLCGFRHLAQVKKLQNYNVIPVIVRELTDWQMAAMVIEANTIRQDLNSIDLARFYKRCLEEFQLSQAELARRHNCSQGEIANTIRLLELPEDIQEKVISQEISETHGRQLLRLNYDSVLQEKMLDTCITEGYSINQLSNDIARTIYQESKNLDPYDYPKPTFDVAGCAKCSIRQKIGNPYSNNKKTWRCLNKLCYQNRVDQAEQALAARLQAAIAAAKKKTGDVSKDVILDCANLTSRDFQSLNDLLPKIDTSECNNCPRRALGKMCNGRKELVCIDVKCFKKKEKAAQDKQLAMKRKAGKQLTKRIVDASGHWADFTAGMDIVAGYLLDHSKKETREKVSQIYGIKELELRNTFSAAPCAIDMLRMVLCLVLQKERYEGDKEHFIKLLADIEGNSAELNKALDAHRAEHCTGCRDDNDSRTCRLLLKRYGEDCQYKCYGYKKTAEEEEVVKEE